ncbi:hypothetical protein RCL1_007282 [Eukaryota sp. TZLM3-RCL]
MRPRRNSLDIDHWIRVSSVLSCKSVSLDELLNLITELGPTASEKILVDLLSFGLTRFPSSASSFLSSCPSKFVKNLCKQVYLEVYELASFPCLLNNFETFLKLCERVDKVLYSTKNPFSLIAFFDAIVTTCPFNICERVFFRFKDICKCRSFVGVWKKFFQRARIEGVLINLLSNVVVLPYHLQEEFLDQLCLCEPSEICAFDTPYVCFRLEDGTLIVSELTNECRSFRVQLLILMYLRKYDLVKDVTYQYFGPQLRFSLEKYEQKVEGTLESCHDNC